MARPLFKLFGMIGMKGVKKTQDSLKGLERKAKKTGKTFDKFAVNISKVGIALAGYASIALAAAVSTKKFVDAASDLSETITASEQIFGNSAKAINDWAETADMAFGQSKRSAIDAANTFAIFGKSAGVTGNDLVKFSTQLVELTADMASFKNTTPEEAITAVGAALRGESEPIRRYGILLNDAVLRQRALKLGLVDTTKDALSPQIKVLAAQAEIFEQSKDIQGDFSRTSGGLANQQRILTAQLENLSAELGESLLPLMTDIVTFLNMDFVPGLKNLINWWKELNPAIKTVVKAVAFNIWWLSANFEKVKQSIIFAFQFMATAIDNALSRITIELSKTLESFIDFADGISQYIPIVGNNIESLRLKMQKLAIEEEQNIKKRNVRLEMLKWEISQIGLHNKATDEATTKTKTFNAVINKNAKNLKNAAEEAKKLAEKRATFEKQWLDKLQESTFTKKMLLDKEYDEAIEQAKKLGADKTNIESFYEMKRIQLAEDDVKKKKEKEKEVLDAKLEFENEYTKKVWDQTLTRRELLEIEKSQALAQAEGLGAETFAIEEYYANESLKLDQEITEQKIANQRAIQDFTIQTIGYLFSVVSDFYSMQIENIEHKKKKEIAAIKHSIMSEEQKAKAIETIEMQSDKKTTELKRKQANADKLGAIFNIGISTAQGIMKAWADFPGPAAAILTVLIAALGIAQTAVVAAKPIPFADGGLIKSKPGIGINAVIGEGQEDEVVFPLKTGVGMIVEELNNRIKNVGAMPGLVASTSTINNDKKVVNVNIGNYIGDDASLMALERKMYDLRIVEDQRRGADG